MYAILKGELNQKALRFDRKMSVIFYLKSIYRKIAIVFSMTCYERDFLSGILSKDYKLDLKIGYHIGVAFWIYDDILNYTFKMNDIHKQTLSNLKEGSILYHLFWHFINTNHFEYLLKKELKINDFEIEQVVKLINHYDSKRLKKL